MQTTENALIHVGDLLCRSSVCSHPRSNLLCHRHTRGMVPRSLGPWHWRLPGSLASTWHVVWHVSQREATSPNNTPTWVFPQSQAETALVLPWLGWDPTIGWTGTGKFWCFWGGRSDRPMQSPTEPWLEGGTRSYEPSSWHEFQQEATTGGGHRY